MSLSRLTRRATLIGASALPFAANAQGTAPAKFPDRPIRLIIPWAAGGPADAGFRILAESVSQKLGQPVIVDNKGGAAGVLGALALQEAKPDGYTICQMHMSMLRQPMLNPQLKYDPIKDLTYILQITGFVMGIVVRPDAPWQTLPELLAYAKANPGKLNWGTLGAGSTQHLAMENLGLKQGLGWTHAPYRGTADTLRALGAARHVRQAAPARGVHRQPRQTLPRGADRKGARPRDRRRQSGRSHRSEGHGPRRGEDPRRRLP